MVREGTRTGHHQRKGRGEMELCGLPASKISVWEVVCIAQKAQATANETGQKRRVNVLRGKDVHLKLSKRLSSPLGKSCCIGMEVGFLTPVSTLSEVGSVCSSK